MTPDAPVEADPTEDREMVRNRRAVATRYAFSGNTVIVPRILIFYVNQESSFHLLADYLLLLMDNNLITMTTLTEHLLLLLRHDDWTAEKFRQLSGLMSRLVVMANKQQPQRRNETSKDDLLLDVLSELTANIDDFSTGEF